MSQTKRTVVTIMAVGAFASILILALGLWLPQADGLLTAIHDVVLLRVIVSVVVLAGLAGAIYALSRVIRLYTRSFAQISAGENGGSISIEKSALVSMTRKSLSRLDSVSIRDVDVEVVQRHGGAVIDVVVKAAPVGSKSLVAMAKDIERVAKGTLESFTEREVRCVTVNFVDPKRKDEDEIIAEVPLGEGSASEFDHVSVDVPTVESQQVENLSAVESEAAPSEIRGAAEEEAAGDIAGNAEIEDTEFAEEQAEKPRQRRGFRAWLHDRFGDEDEVIEEQIVDTPLIRVEDGPEEEEVPAPDQSAQDEDLPAAPEPLDQESADGLVAEGQDTIDEYLQEPGQEPEAFLHSDDHEPRAEGEQSKARDL